MLILKDLVEKLDTLLDVKSFEKADCALNGLQLGNFDSKIDSVAFAVDCCSATIKKAAMAKTNLLIVHHGLFWGKPVAITGNCYSRVRDLLTNDIALYACHLPLDANAKYGNNAQIAKKLELTNLEPFGLYHGIKIGTKGILPQSKTIPEILTTLGTDASKTLGILPFGEQKIKSVAIVSGGAASEVEQAISEGVDCFITGEISHQIYHTCMEEKINYIALGHYESETFGVKALKEYVESELNLKTIFIDEQTNL